NYLGVHSSQKLGSLVRSHRNRPGLVSLPLSASLFPNDDVSINRKLPGLPLAWTLRQKKALLFHREESPRERICKSRGHGSGLASSRGRSQDSRPVRTPASAEPWIHLCRPPACPELPERWLCPGACSLLSCWLCSGGPAWQGPMRLSHCRP
ncbi:unnamed protein product, partial [Gulo gulo]